jgi:hypothetical protein
MPPISSVEQPEARCPNCGTRINDNFCPHCGQENERRIVSLRLLAKDVVDNFFTLDARLPQTLMPLLFNPGLLTREYLAGRRARYARPSRLYLAISVTFFFILSVFSGGEIDTVFFQPSAAEGAVVDTTQLRVDSLYGQIGNALTAGLPQHMDVRRDERRINVEDDSTEVSITLERTATESVEEDMRTQVISGLTNYLPKMMFIMLPVFALFLKLLYLRRQRYYVGHLIFAFNYHSFAFIVFLVTTITSVALPELVSGIVNALLMVYMHVYLFVAMYRVYDESWFKTLLKFFVLYICYSTVLGIGLVGIIMLSLQQVGEFPF